MMSRGYVKRSACAVTSSSRPGKFQNDCRWHDRATTHTHHRHIVSATELSHRTDRSSIFCNGVFARSVPDMFAARHNVVELEPCRGKTEASFASKTMSEPNSVSPSTHTDRYTYIIVVDNDDFSRDFPG